MLVLKKDNNAIKGSDAVIFASVVDKAKTKQRVDGSLQLVFDSEKMEQEALDTFKSLNLIVEQE